MRTFVIAEAASTHDRNFDKALQLIALARDIGADACKFQWVSSAEALCARRRAPEYLRAYELIHFPQEWFPPLRDACHAAGIEFMCTAYLLQDIGFIEQYVDRLKISSFESQDPFMTKGAFTKPIIVSLGMAGRPLAWPGADVKYLHCVSAYPTPVEEINLARVRQWPCSGLSDHTTHLWTGALATAAGAQIIEFHVRLFDTNPANADYQVSRGPAEAQAYVKHIRLAEQMLGSGDNQVMPSERPMIKHRWTS